MTVTEVRPKRIRAGSPIKSVTMRVLMAGPKTLTFAVDPPFPVVETGWYWCALDIENRTAQLRRCLPIDEQALEAANTQP
jgi:hypothetical protein